MTTQLGLRRIGEQQASFRTTNETIQATADSVPILGRIPFVCECPSELCSETVQMTFEEYEAVRQHPRRFFNVPGHEEESVAAGAETVLVVFDRFSVVEKIGAAGEIADDTHNAER